jgi:hypothetical protein
MDITKFEDLADPGFMAVVAELRRWVKDSIENSNSRRRSGGEDDTRGREGRRVLRITQGGSQSGPTTVSRRG